MELLKNFGFDPILLAAQIVNFIIVLWVLKKFLYKPILEVLRKRQAAIEEGIRNSEQAEKRLAETLDKEKNILKEAQAEAKKIIEDAKNQSVEILKAAKDSAQLAGENLIAEARQQITQQTQEAEKGLRKTVSSIAIEFLQKAVHEIFEEKDQQRIMSKAIKQLEKKPN